MFTGYEAAQSAYDAQLPAHYDAPDEEDEALCVHCDEPAAGDIEGEPHCEDCNTRGHFDWEEPREPDAEHIAEIRATWEHRPKSSYF